MRISGKHSHLNGEEHLLARRPDLWAELQRVIGAVDADECRVKTSRETTQAEKTLYSSAAMNVSFKRFLEKFDWQERGNNSKVMAASGHDSVMGCNQTDFVKDRVAVEIRFDKIAPDWFASHLGFYISDIIDVGIEILPMKSLQQEMSSEVLYFEQGMTSVIRQGRNIPAVPLVLLGIEP